MKIKLRDYRLKKNMSIRDLESASGVDKAAISRIEHGYSEPTIGTLCLLSDALGISLDELVDCNCEND